MTPSVHAATDFTIVFIARCKIRYFLNYLSCLYFVRIVQIKQILRLWCMIIDAIDFVYFKTDIVKYTTHIFCFISLLIEITTEIFVNAYNYISSCEYCSQVVRNVFQYKNIMNSCSVKLCTIYMSAVHII